MPELLNTDYALTITDLIKQFLRDSEYGNYFKNFFYGNPEEGVGVNDCPCVIVAKEDSSTVQGPTGMDQVSENIMIRIILSKMHFNDQGPLDEVLTQREFEDLVEGIDATTGQYTDNSVKGVLRKNFTLGNAIQNQTINVSYGKVINPVIDEITRECQVKVYVEYLMQTPGKV